MKLLLIAFVFWTSHALAQACNSIWVYQPYLSCTTPANGPDLSQPTEVSPPQVIPTGSMDGGPATTADIQCENRRAARDVGYPDHVVKGVLTAPGSGGPHKNSLGHVTYEFFCPLKSVSYPYQVAPNPRCGVDQALREDPGTTPQSNIPGAAKCLSCDNVDAAPELYNCLKDSVERVIEPGTVALRPDDLKAVAARVETLIGYVQEYPNALGMKEGLNLPKLEKSVKAAADNLQ